MLPYQLIVVYMSIHTSKTPCLEMPLNSRTLPIVWVSPCTGNSMGFPLVQAREVLYGSVAARIEGSGSAKPPFSAAHWGCCPSFRLMRPSSHTLGPPVVPLFTFFWGSVPYQNRLQQKVGTH